MREFFDNLISIVIFTIGYVLVRTDPNFLAGIGGGVLMLFGFLLLWEGNKIKSRQNK